MQKKFIMAILTMALMMCLSVAAFAAPASEQENVVWQDGVQITIIGGGDEHLHWTKDVEGNLVTVDEDSNFVYGEWDHESGQLVSTGVTISQAAPPQAATIYDNFPQIVIDTARSLKEAWMPQGEQFGPDLSEILALSLVTADTEFPGIGTASVRRNVLIFNVQYHPTALASRAPRFVAIGSPFYDHLAVRENLFDGSNPWSMNSYFKEVFNVDYDASVPAITLGGFSGVFDVMLPSSFNPIMSAGSNTGNLGRDSIQIACSSIPGFREAFRALDTNGNNQLSQAEAAIAYVVQGYEGATGDAAIIAAGFPSIWAHAPGSPPSGIVVGDGRPNMSLASCNYISQLHYRDGSGPPLTVPNGNDALFTHGILTHEYGHSGYSWNDTYDYGSSVADGQCHAAGAYAMQAAGNWGHINELGDAPSLVDPYNLVAVGNPRVTPVTIDYREYREISGMKLNTDIVRINASGAGTTYGRNQYFLIQTRSYKGFDKGMFGRFMHPNRPAAPERYPHDLMEAKLAQGEPLGGILVWFVDPGATPQRINDKNSHPRTGVVEAHGGVRHMSIVTEGTPTPGFKDYTRGNRGHLPDFFGLPSYYSRYSEEDWNPVWGEYSPDNLLAYYDETVYEDHAYSVTECHNNPGITPYPQYRNFTPRTGNTGTPFTVLSVAGRSSNCFAGDTKLYASYNSAAGTIDYRTVDSLITMVDFLFDFEKGGSFTNFGLPTMTGLAAIPNIAAVGGTRQITPTGTYINAAHMNYMDMTVNNGATVDAAGLITVPANTTTSPITYTVTVVLNTPAYGTQTRTTTFVQAPSPELIGFELPYIEMNSWGGVRQNRAVGTNLQQYDLVYSISPEDDGATVDQDGVVTVERNITTATKFYTVTATLTGTFPDSPISVSYLITCYRANAISSVNIVGGTAITSMKKGAELTLSAQILPSEDAVLSYGWTSSNTAVVTIDATTGEMKAIGVGNAVITLTVNTVDGTITKVITVRVS